MKKIIKIAAITLIALLLILLVSPVLFKGKIIEVVKSETNKTMNARIDFKNLGLSFFRSFPHASVSLSDFVITGVDEFEGDTLMYAGDIAATVNIKSFFGGSGYEITKVSLSDAKLNALVLEGGKANWEIMPEGDKEEADKEEAEDAAFKLYLKDVSVGNTDIVYDDKSTGIKAVLKGLNLNLSGDMTADETTIRTRLTIDALSFIMDKIPYLSQAKADATLDINANLKEMKFTLADNKIQLNEIKVNVNGWVAMAAEEVIEMDIRLDAPSTRFKDVLSMIPAIYAKDFEKVKTDGSATLEAWAKGTMKGEELPAFELRLNVADGMFQYPDLPKSVRNINSAILVSSSGGSTDNTVIDISKFHFEIGGNPFDLKLNLKTPVSDPDIRMSAVGVLDLGTVKEVYPLEDMELNGNLQANLNLATRMSYIEKEQFDKVEATGTVSVGDMQVEMSDMDPVEIRNASLFFSPQYVDLKSFSAQIGKNDLAASGKLENFLPYFLKDETLKGTLKVSSNYLNLNDFMSESGKTETAASPDTVTLGLIEVPRNLNLMLTGDFKEVIFDNLEMSNVAGEITVKDGKVSMKNLAMNALGGSMKVSGYYDTKVPEKPEVSMSLNIKEASFSKTFSTFVTIQKLAPIFEGMFGNYSTNLQLTTPLGEGFSPILSSLTANGSLASNNVEVKDIAVLNGLASALKNESLKDLKIKDLNLPFAINDGRVATSPFDIKFGAGTMNLSGTTGLDQTIDYIAKVKLSDKASNKYLQSVNVKIGGTFSSPKFSLDTKDAADQLLGNLAGSLLGSEDNGSSLSDQIADKKAELTEKTAAELEKQAEKIRTEAKEAGDKLVAEAEKQGQKLIDEANKTSNALAKVAAVKGAEAAAKKLKEEAGKQAEKLNEEAEKQAKALLEKAK